MYIFLPLIPTLCLILMLVLVVSDSSSGDTSTMAGVFFVMPFEYGINPTVASEFGERVDPITGETSFHSGIDLDAPEGSNIVASANGTVVEVGYDEDGLGNYVYIKHDFDGLIYYSAYGHMLDNSIVVSVNDEVVSKQKIGVIGSSGRSTGVHLHFVLMSPDLSFNQKNLVNPINVINGL